MRQLAKRTVTRAVVLLCVAAASVPVVSCNLALGLNKFIDCPGDPTCPTDATCDDGVKDGSETDVDCGGSCAKCVVGKGCLTGADCVEGACAEGACQSPGCTDGVKNGSETDVDCGGSCSPCAEGKGCLVDGDCVGMQCSNGACAPTCTDKQKDGQETDVDCGGSCTPCADALGCATDTDCASGICQTSKCAGVEVWEKSFDDASPVSNATTTVVAVDGMHNVLLGGTYTGSIDLGGGAFTTSTNDVFVAKYDSTGTYKWSTHPGRGQGMSAIASDGAGNTDFVAVYETSFTWNFSSKCTVINPGTYSSGPSLLVGQLDANGDPVWCNGYGNTSPNGNASASSIAVDGTGNIAVEGLLESSTADFGGGAALTGSTHGDAFLVGLDSGGGYRWAQQLHASNFSSSSTPGTLAFDAAGNVVATGSFLGTVTVGSVSLTTTSGAGFVVKVAPTGTVSWAKSFDGDYAAFVATDATGAIYLGGTFSGTIDFGGGALTSAGAHDVFLAKLDATGAHVWSKSFGDVSDQGCAGLRLDSQGRLVLTGSFAGTIDFGGGPLVSTGGPMTGANLYLAVVDQSGNHLGSRRFGDAHGQNVTSLAVDTTNAALLTGTFSATLDFGDGGAPLTNPDAGSTDVFLAKLRLP